MSSTNDTWNDFFYGEVGFLAEEVTAVYLGPASSKTTGFFSMKKVGGIIASTLLACSLFLSTGAGASSTINLKPNLIYQQLELRLPKARKTLTLSQQETADILNVSLSTIQKAEQGNDHTPSMALTKEYQDLFELEEFLLKHVGKRRFAISALLRTPLEVYGNKTALEFAKSTSPRGVRKVLSILQRTYA